MSTMRTIRLKVEQLPAELRDELLEELDGWPGLNDPDLTDEERVIFQEAALLVEQLLELISVLQDEELLEMGNEV